MKCVLSAVLGVAMLLGLTGCPTPSAPVIPAFDQVDSQLPKGEYGLFKLRPDQYPNMTAALSDRANLEIALTRSIEYMEAPSSNHFFAGAPISHDQVYAALLDLRDKVHNNVPASQIQSEIVAKYEVWAAKGYNWNSRPKDEPGKVWFTAYYTPIYQGSRTPTSEFKYPIYKTPDDLVKMDETGMKIGRKVGNTVVEGYPTRAQLTANNATALKGLELLYFRDPLEAYIIQVQGSAMVYTPTDPRGIMVGYAASNGGKYLGLGTQLREKGILSAKEVSLSNVVKFFHDHPAELETYTNNSERFVFMKEYTTDYEKAQWPSGSIGRKVTDLRSLATDKEIFPRAAVTFIDVPNPMGPPQRIMLDQDTGGAIRAAGRADIYVGQGASAGALAGQQYSEGHLFYVVMKPENTAAIISRLGKQAKAVTGPATPTAPKIGTMPPRTGTGTGGGEMFPK